MSTPLTPGRIGNVELRNRIIRSATQETMADDDGYIRNPEFRDLHVDLARGGVGLNVTGHCFVDPRGLFAPGMTGLANDDHIPGLAAVSEAVHEAGGKIFPELNHAGAQCHVDTIDPIGPSAVRNAQTGRMASAASEDEITAIVDAFGAAAERAQKAGCDGIHVHAGHGYLLSSFLSPHTNRRDDRWGGSLENRQRLLREVIGAIKSATAGSFPVTVKLGMRDFVEDGLPLNEGVATGEMLDELDVAAIEVSAGLTSPVIESVVQYAGTKRRRAVADKLVWRAFAPEKPEGYFLDFARALRPRIGCKLILVGGVRSLDFMSRAMADDGVDFFSLSRPLIRQPDLPRRLAAGETAACTSCNICVMHDGVHSVRCWRTSGRRLMTHAYYRFSGKLGSAKHSAGK
jgi:2,4-dienoyl-CoA reductase-like NADH-dependent reductase (Old Yellow Enzyme family)